MSKTVWKGVWFCGNKVSDYGIENGFIDYRTLAKSFDCVLNNEIIQKTMGKGFEWETVNGSECYWYDENGNEYFDYDEIPEDKRDSVEEEYYEFYQHYIISDAGYHILSDYTNETVWYCEELDCYVWGVTHWGTSWNYVLTDIPIDKKAIEEYRKEAENND